MHTGSHVDPASHHLCSSQISGPEKMCLVQRRWANIRALEGRGREYPRAGPEGEKPKVASQALPLDLLRRSSTRSGPWLPPSWVAGGRWQGVCGVQGAQVALHSGVSEKGGHRSVRTQVFGGKCRHGLNGGVTGLSQCSCPPRTGVPTVQDTRVSPLPGSPPMDGVHGIVNSCPAHPSTENPRMSAILSLWKLRHRRRMHSCHCVDCICPPVALKASFSLCPLTPAGCCTGHKAFPQPEGGGMWPTRRAQQGFKRRNKEVVGLECAPWGARDHGRGSLSLCAMSPAHQPAVAPHRQCQPVPGPGRVAHEYSLSAS